MTYSKPTTSKDPAAPPAAAGEVVGPLLGCWRSGHWNRADRYPDAVTDTTRRRKSKAKRNMPHVRRVREQAARMGLGVGLIHAVLPVNGALYSPADHAAARRTVSALLTVDGVKMPHWVKLEGLPADAGVSDLHGHIITSAAALPHLQAAGVWCKLCPTANDLAALVSYDSKPADMRAVRHNHQREPVAPAAAAESYLQARAAAYADNRRRLPSVTFTGHVPPRPRAPQSPMVNMQLLVQAALILVLHIIQADMRRRYRVQNLRYKVKQARAAAAPLIAARRRAVVALVGPPAPARALTLTAPAAAPYRRHPVPPQPPPLPAPYRC